MVTSYKFQRSKLFNPSRTDEHLTAKYFDGGTNIGYRISSCELTTEIQCVWKGFLKAQKYFFEPEGKSTLIKIMDGWLMSISA